MCLLCLLFLASLSSSSGIDISVPYLLITMFSTCFFHIYKPVLILHFFPMYMLVSESSEEAKSAVLQKSVRESLCLISSMYVNEMIPYVLLQDLFPIKLCRPHLINLPSFNSFIACIACQSSSVVSGQTIWHAFFPSEKLNLSQSLRLHYLGKTLATSPFSPHFCFWCTNFQVQLVAYVLVLFHLSQFFPSKRHLEILIYLPEIIYIERLHQSPYDMLKVDVASAVSTLHFFPDFPCYGT